MQKYLLLLAGIVLISFVSAANETEVCVPVYNFIMTHYNGTLNYLVYEFNDLKQETNLTTSELKDYLINYDDLCYLILPFNYEVMHDSGEKETVKESVTGFLKSMFDDPKSFLMVIGFIIVIILFIKELKK